MTRSATRLPTSTLLALLLVAGLACSCGGGGGGGDGGGDLQLAGPFVIDFESPAADNVPETQPFDLGAGITATSPTNVILWSNAQGWALTEDGLCDAAFVGSQGLGSDDETDNHTLVINFPGPMATVEFLYAAAVGTTVTAQTLDSLGNVIDTIPLAAPPCPGPMFLVRFGLSPTTNTIWGLRINGNVPVIDNLTWYRFQ
jgi:hypothetical protein